MSTTIALTNFNALVDDDGSNLVGTVINKATIASVILTPVQAAVTALDAVDAAEAAARIAADALKSPLASPTFTGTPAAPTAAPGTNTTQLATTAFTVAEIAANAPTWVSVAHAGGNFTAGGGGSWTVASGDQIVFQYIKIGRLCTINIVLDTTSVSGTVTSLAIASPVTAAKPANVLATLYNNSSSTAIAAVCAISGASISVLKLDGSALAASTDLTYLRLQLTFEW